MGDRISRVLVTGNRIATKHLKLLSQSGMEVLNPTEDLTEQALVQQLKGVQAYVLAGDELASAQVLEQCAELRLIAFLGAGYQSFIDMEATNRLGIAVTSTPGVNARAVAELTVAHVLNSRRKLAAMNTVTKTGQFPRTVTNELSGARVGIVGMGAVGTATARMLVAGFGAEVSYHSRTRKPEVERELGIEAGPLDELLRTSEVVVLLLTAAPETTGYLDADRLALMRPDAILINTARAALVDGHALRAALQAGTIGAAAFDGYYQEPVPAPDRDGYGLLTLPDDLFVLTPHVGALTHDANARMAELVMDSVLNFSRTGDDRHVTNPEFRLAQRQPALNERGIGHHAVS